MEAVKEILCCPECKGTVFIQKSVHKTGVQVVNGQAMFVEPFPTPTADCLICKNCKNVLLPSYVKNFKPLELVRPAPAQN